MCCLYLHLLVWQRIYPKPLPIHQAIHVYQVVYPLGVEPTTSHNLLSYRDTYLYINVLYCLYF